MENGCEREWGKELGNTGIAMDHNAGLTLLNERGKGSGWMCPRLSCSLKMLWQCHWGVLKTKMAIRPRNPVFPENG